MHKIPGMFFGILLFVSSTASAGLALDVAKSDFRKQSEAIRSAVNTGGDLTEITAEDRRTVLDRLASIERSLDGKGFSALEQGERDQISADQVLINEALARAEADSKLVCRNETKTGSNRLKRVCVTVAAQRRSYELTQNMMGKGAVNVSAEAN